MCRANVCSEITDYDLDSELGLTTCEYVDPDNTGRIKPGKNDLSIMQINTRGLLNKIDHLRDIINYSHPDVILLCETWLNTRTLDLVEIKGYKLVNKIRVDRIGGGVGILMKKELRTRSRDDLCVETQDLEHVVVELKTDTKNILLVSGYRPPNTSVKTMLQDYKRLLTNLRKCKHHELIIGLDHNLDLMKTHIHKQTSEFLEMNLSNDLTPCITKPTRITHTTATLLDNIFVSPKLHHNLSPFILTEDISDHLPIIALLGNQKKSLKQSITVTVRNLSDENTQLIREDLERIDWENVLKDQNCSTGFSTFHQTLCESMDKHAPEKKKKLNYKRQIRDPWITKGILTSLARQKKLYREQLHAKSAVSTHKYRRYRNLLKSTIRKSKQTYLHNKCVEFRQDSRKLWKLVNKIIGKNNNKTETIDSLRVDNILKHDPDSITNGLCTFFSNIGENYANKIGEPDINISEYIGQIDPNPQSLFFSPTTVHEIKELILKLPMKTSSGYDNISNVLLKKLCTSITTPLSIIFNKSLEEGAFPEDMKLADVVPLFKSKDRNECTNYRPISLLLTISKLLEKIVYCRTYKFLERHDKLYVSQYGFREGHSCENAISELVSEIVKRQQEGMYTLALFLDLSKAFDSLEHSVLLNKLSRYGVRGKTNEWFASYLQNRKMRVKCNVTSTGNLEYSQYQTVNYGIPQGSCLGPLIFIIFTNDLNNQLMNTASLLFADDTTIYMSHRHLKYLKWCVEEDMKRLITWFKANKLTLNLGKTVCVLFQRNGQRQTITLDLYNIQITNAKEVKFLGLWLDEYLTWCTHVQKLILKLTRNLNLLKYSKKMMPKETKKLVYHAHIGSHIQYGLVLWGNGVTNEQIQKLQRIQDQSMYYISGDRIRNTSVNKDLKMLRIIDLIRMANLKFGYKFLHNLLPKKVWECCKCDSKNKCLMPKHSYNTRSKQIPNLPVNMNKKYHTSYLVLGPRSILTLNVETRESRSLQSFTITCKRNIINNY